MKNRYALFFALLAGTVIVLFVQSWVLLRATCRPVFSKLAEPPKGLVEGDAGPSPVSLIPQVWGEPVNALTIGRAKECCPTTSPQHPQSQPWPH